MGFWSLLWGYWSTQTKTSVKASKKCRLFGTFLSMLLSHYVYAFGKWIQQSVWDSKNFQSLKTIQAEVGWNIRVSWTGVWIGPSETLKGQLWKRKKQKERRKLSQEINTLSKVVIGKYQKAYNERWGSFNDFGHDSRSDSSMIASLVRPWWSVHTLIFQRSRYSICKYLAKNTSTAEKWSAR